jgi:hypothetical protein
MLSSQTQELFPSSQASGSLTSRDDSHQLPAPTTAVQGLTHPEHESTNSFHSSQDFSMQHSNGAAMTSFSMFDRTRSIENMPSPLFASLTGDINQQRRHDPSNTLNVSSHPTDLLHYSHSTHTVDRMRSYSLDVPSNTHPDYFFTKTL